MIQSATSEWTTLNWVWRTFAVGVPVLLPQLIIGIVPLITGDVAMQAFQPFATGTRRAPAAGVGTQLQLPVALPQRAAVDRMESIKVDDAQLARFRRDPS